MAACDVRFVVQILDERLGLRNSKGSYRVRQQLRSNTSGGLEMMNERGVSMVNLTSKRKTYLGIMTYGAVGEAA